MAIKLLGLVGSLREGSLNRALARAIGGQLPDGNSFELFERLGEIPGFNADLSVEPEAVAALKDAIRGADGVLIVTPEYNYSMPGVLKNAIDWVSRPAPSPLKRKPIGIAGASVGLSGSMRAQYHLRQVFVFSDSPVMNQPEVILPRAQDRFKDGVLIDDSTRTFLATYAKALVEFVERNRSV